METLPGYNVTLRTVQVWADRFCHEEDLVHLCERSDQFSEFVFDLRRDGERFEDETLSTVTIARVPAIVTPSVVLDNDAADRPYDDAPARQWTRWGRL